ncbi:MAG: hypothetical protein U5K54_25980 [Cytophagales bacterium]|nr:hypothetical protein [Cytophagales bacterium]
MKETKDTKLQGGLIEKWKEHKRKKVDRINERFNALPLRTKQVSVIFFGILMAMTCVVLVVKAIRTEMIDSIPIDKITLPKETFMNKAEATKELIPVGKLKGEINGEFEAFYVAVDGEGQAYINRNPSFGAHRFVKSEEWQPISRKQLESYEKELHFIPHKTKGLKP